MSDDPLAPDDPLAMTHFAPRPNPAEPLRRAVMGFFSGGLQGAGMRMPPWLQSNVVQRAVQNPDNVAAMGIMTPIKGTGVRMGSPELGDLRPAANQNLTLREFTATEHHAQRARILDKLIANRDFKPSIADGRLKFPSLSAEENEIINRIGYSRAPQVTWQQEADPLTAAQAWEKNLKYWRDLSLPPEE